MSAREPEQVQQQLIDYLSRHADVREKVDATTDLIERGLLDSLLVTDLVMFARKQFGVELTARDISPEKLGSVQRIAALICEKEAARRDRAA
ncbi:MAG: acyl carrier protein [Planctomycetes bacterium]|nr:acyl carrier protein [Planctomycetota bacterium]